VNENADRANEAPEYQSLSSLATLALVMSLLSPLALATPLMLVAPAAAIGVALLALAKIRASDGALTGVKVAQCGLAIAVACGVAAFVRDPVRNMLMRRQTADVARVWLTQLAEDKLIDARALLSAQAVQSLGPAPGNPSDEPPPLEVIEAAVLERLGDDPMTQALSALQRPLSVNEESSTAQPPVFDGGRTLVTGDFIVKPAGDGAPVRVNITFVRAAYYESQGLPWRVERWSLAPEGGEAGSHSS
jgi:hypothetical protein